MRLEMKYKEFHFKTLYKDCNQINNSTFADKT